MTNAHEAQPLTLLDCTLRDGGYYTRWDFAPQLVSKYLTAVKQAGIAVVELGLRAFPKDGWYGPFAYTTEAFLMQLSIPEGLRVAVMVDAKTLLSSSLPIKEAVAALFCDASQSKCDLVRIAAHFDELPECPAIVDALSQLGYPVAVNMMQASGKSEEAIKDRLRALLSAETTPEALYFADSLGNMDGDEVKRLISAFRQVWSGAIGIHTHNNRGLAIANSLTAIAAGVTWVDATIQGMGRGAGNAEMELLLTELAAHSHLHPEAVYPLALEEFAELKARHQWGASLLYYYSALHNIHPSYAQELSADQRYSTAEKITIIRNLGEQASTRFTQEKYHSAVHQDFKPGPGTWDASHWCEDRAVVLVAAGPRAIPLAADIVAFAERRGALLLTVNTLSHIPAASVDGVVSVDQNRILFEIDSLCKLEVPVYAPSSNLPDRCHSALSSLDVKDYGVALDAKAMAIAATSCQLPRPLSAVYALALCIQGGASRIYLAGFDGFPSGDPRQTEMVECLEQLRKIVNLDALALAITPTSYPLKQGSLYAP